jgi:uncharacterized protein
MNQSEIIEKTIAFVKQELDGAEGGHDWWHMERVWKTTRHIAATEDVDMFTVELGSLLHDIADAKFHDGDEEVGPRKAREFLQSIGVESSVIEHVENIIRHISYRKSLDGQTFMSPELAIVQDADRLDAIGAIGIARTFNYGGSKGREMYNPTIKPDANLTKDQYKNSTTPTVNHFYEKLLLLKDKMNTETGKKMAAERHEFMERYLAQFYDEWAGIK